MLFSAFEPLLKVSVTIRLETGSDYSLELDLAHPIVAEKSAFKVLKSKVR